MQAIIDFFNTIGNVISTVIDFVVKMFSDLVFMLKLLANFFASLPSYLSWLPSAAVSSIVLIFTIVMIYKILGREG